MALNTRYPPTFLGQPESAVNPVQQEADHLSDFRAEEPNGVFIGNLPRQGVSDELLNELSQPREPSRAHSVSHTVVCMGSNRLLVCSDAGRSFDGRC